jgi:hypothetical protein
MDTRHRSQLGGYWFEPNGRERVGQLLWEQWFLLTKQTIFLPETRQQSRFWPAVWVALPRCGAGHSDSVSILSEVAELVLAYRRRGGEGPFTSVRSIRRRPWHQV